MNLNITTGGIKFPKAERRKVHDVAAMFASAAMIDAKYKPAAEALKAALRLVGPVDESEEKGDDE